MALDMRAAIGSATRAAQNARCDEYGIKLIQVSSHLGARPLCAPYQGRIYSRDGSRGVTTDGAGGKIEYTPLSETSYGDPAGLFGVNCGHVQLPFIPGVDMQKFFPYPKDENDEYYQKLQKQRYIERQIKATKRECMMFDATGDKEELARSSLKLRNQQVQYANYCKSAGLSRNDERTQVLGYDKSVSSKTSGAAQKALDKSGESGIINNKPEIILENRNYKEASPVLYDSIQRTHSSKLNSPTRKAIANHRKADGSNGGYVASYNYSNLNQKLRDNEYNLLDNDDKKTIEAMRSAISKNTLGSDLVLTRYVNASYLHHVFDIDENSVDNVFAITAKNSQKRKEIISQLQNKIETEFTEKAFVSTSLLKNNNVMTNKPVRLTISAPKETHCYVPDNKRESECILGENTRFYITDVRESVDGKIEILATIIN